MKVFAGTRAERLSGLEPLLRQARNLSILDIGCHAGVIASAFAAHGATPIDGVDMHAPAIERARQLLAARPTARARFAVCDLVGGLPALAEALPNMPLRYDAVLYLGMHHHLARQMSLQALRRFEQDITDLADRFFAVRTRRDQMAVVDKVIRSAGFETWAEDDSSQVVGSLRIYTRA